MAQARFSDQLGPQIQPFYFILKSFFLGPISSVELERPNMLAYLHFHASSHVQNSWPSLPSSPVKIRSAFHMHSTSALSFPMGNQTAHQLCPQAINRSSTPSPRQVLLPRASVHLPSCTSKSPAACHALLKLAGHVNISLLPRQATLQQAPAHASCCMPLSTPPPAKPHSSHHLSSLHVGHATRRQHASTSTSPMPCSS